MKYLIFSISLIYIISFSSCKSKTEIDDHQHDEVETVVPAHIHEEGVDHVHAEEPVAADSHLHAEGDAHVHAEEPVADDGHLHAEGDAVHSEDAPVAVEPDDHTHEAEDHTIMKVEKTNFRFTHKTSGQILVDKKDEILITATNPGIIRFFDHLLFPGVALKSGQQMFGIYGDMQTEGNPSVNYNNALLEYESAQANFNRASRLIEEKLITEEHFLNLKLEFEKAKLKFSIFNQNSGVDGSFIKAPFNCYIQDIYVKEGQKVETGEKLATVIIEHNLILRADVAPSDLGILSQIKDARFSTGYNPRVFSTIEMNGKMISFGKSTNENSYYIPVYFRIDYNHELIPGTFAQVWLLGSVIEDVITVPNRSIMEEYGKFYLFVENSDGTFEKRFITTGRTDGEVTHIVAGLHESELVVVDGAYQIKMSQMTSIPNTHDHNH